MPQMYKEQQTNFIQINNSNNFRSNHGFDGSTETRESPIYIPKNKCRSIELYMHFKFHTYSTRNI